MSGSHKTETELIQELRASRTRVQALEQAELAHAQVEDALRTANDRLEYLLASTAVAVYTARPSGDYGATSITGNVRQMTGYEPRDFTESLGFWIDHVHPQDRQRILDDLTGLFEHGSHSYEYRFLNKDGTYRWIRDEMKLTRDEAGEATEIVGYFIDITERKRAEEEKAKSEARLRHAHKMQAVGQLAAGVAHDFNSILTVILSNAERTLSKMNEDRIASAEAEALRQIVSSVERGAGLVRRLLAFGRTGGGKPQLLDLNRVVVDMDAMLRSLIGGQTELRVRTASDIKAIYADVGQIEEVIMNLALNARDAMPDGGKLTIETAHVTLDKAYARAHIEAKPGSHAVLIVNDTGTGMNEETMQRMFEPFFTTKSKEKGNGLGLSIVHGIVTQAGGHIEVTSKPGDGTSFKLYFPATTQDVGRVPPVGGHVRQST
ncbi:MAG: ATP-binding protein [Planctomycetota bacterium]